MLVSQALPHNLRYLRNVCSFKIHNGDVCKFIPFSRFVCFVFENVEINCLLFIFERTAIEKTFRHRVGPQKAGVTKRRRLFWLTNSALVNEPKCGGMGVVGGSQFSANDYSCIHGAQINYVDLTPSASTRLRRRELNDL